MLIIIRAPHERVVQLVEAAADDAIVGPTSPGGWTAAWWDAARESLEVGRLAHLGVDETHDAVWLGVSPAEGDPVELRWAHGDGDPQGAVVEASRVLADLFGAPEGARELLEDRLRMPHGDVDEVIEELAETLALPELEVSSPERGVVLHHGDPTAVRLAAAIAGPASLLDLGDGWTAVAPAAGGVGPEHLAMAVSTSGGRRDRTLLLWRRGPTSGVQVWSRGVHEVEWTWNDPWTPVVADPLDREAYAAGRLVSAAGREVHEPTLRSLLRRRASDSDPLVELLALLGLPSDAVALLDAPDALAARVESVERSSARRALLHQLRSAHRKPVPHRLRVLFSVYAAATVLMAAVAVLAAIVSIAVVATDGGFVDQQGTGVEDVVWLLTFLALALVLVPTAVQRVRRALRSWTSRRSERDSG